MVTLMVNWSNMAFRTFILLVHCVLGNPLSASLDRALDGLLLVAFESFYSVCFSEEVCGKMFLQAQVFK